MIEKAITAGFEALDSFNSWQQKRGQEVLKQLGPGEKAIVILGRAYNTCDSALTLDLPRRLRDLGVMAIPLDFLPLSSVAADVSTAHPNMYWKSGQKIMCAAKLIADDPRLFGLYMTNFGCGPDSYILKFFGRETEGKPFLTIEIDEHSADAGVVTRCEAFIDTIHNARTRGTREHFEIAEFVSTHTNGKRVFVPYMIDHGYVLAAAMKYCGQDAEALPESDATTLEIGSRYTSGKECYPSIITTGDIVKRTMESDFDPRRSAFFMPGASGPCRFGQYNKLHRLVLDEIGLPEVPILVFDQTRSYHDHMATLGGTRFRLQIWKGIVALDLMQKMLLERRPYEVNKGETDAVYKDLLGSLIKVTEQDSDFRPFTQKVTDGFNSVKKDNGVRKPRVGIVGEIFVRSNPFANDYIVRKLEALGAQCAVPPLEEWIDYIDFQRKRRFRYHIEGGWKDWMRQKITEIVQERSAEPLRKHFDRDIECFARELPTNKILELGQNYISPEIEGEAVLSMGRSLEYIEHGFDGIVNIMPFGCMPGTIVSMLFHLLRQEHNIPVFNLVVDGTKEAGLDIRLEAFVHQCLEHKKQSLNSSRLAH